MMETILVVVLGLAMIVASILYYRQASMNNEISDLTQKYQSIVTEVVAVTRSKDGFGGLAALNTGGLTYLKEVSGLSDNI